MRKSGSGFWKLEGTLERNDAVEYRLAFFGVVDICTEESVSYELEAVVCFGIFQALLYIAVFQNGQGVQVQVQGTVFVVYPFFFINDIFIQTNLCLYVILGAYPVNGSFYFSSVRRIASLGRRNFP